MKLNFMLSAVSLSLFSAIASAGAVQPAPVQIDLDARSASGDMLTASDSKNKFEFIGCGVRYSTAGLTTAFCQAGLGEEDSQRAFCSTNNPNLVEAIKTITAFSYISFRWDVDGNCTNIGVSSQSLYLPELKPRKK